ncbi:MAG: MBL fold metallo-hydrolase [Syntrophobacterales bacterium]|nr:MBL fold metallo-hydrolase [Syntrophobacterales bacterium]
MKKALWIIIFLVIVTCIVLCATNPVPFDEARWRKTVESQSIEKLYAPNFIDGKYFNPWMPQEQGKFWQFLRWRFSRKSHYTDEERAHKPKVLSRLRERINALAGEEDFIAWIGHGTFLIRLQGEYWLTDPMFFERALFPKRVTPPAFTGDDLRELTDTVNVIISHNHYDHLDVKSIRSLPDKSRLFVPRGLKQYVSSLHDGVVTELDWWESVDLPGGTKLVCLPAQHWSRRIGQPVNSTLWASFMVIAPDTSVYYGGDSGYFVGYKEIGRRFPNITYALLPVTAYHPRWFMHYAHINATEALDAFRDLGAEYFIPTQWGAFRLGDNPPGHPVLDLRKAMHEQNVDPSRFILMDIGQITQIE